MSVVRCLFRDKSVPKSYWYMAVFIAVYLINRTPGLESRSYEASTPVTSSVHPIPILDEVKNEVVPPSHSPLSTPFSPIVGGSLTVGDFLISEKVHSYLLQDTGMLGCKPTSTPMDPNVKLTSESGELLEDPVFNLGLGRYVIPVDMNYSFAILFPNLLCSGLLDRTLPRPNIVDVERSTADKSELASSQLTKTGGRRQDKNSGVLAAKLFDDKIPLKKKQFEENTSRADKWFIEQYQLGIDYTRTTLCHLRTIGHVFWVEV
ncbi:hypothetical protein CsSME_00027734 [Camellia sinensis var. sinensis]